jgi:hypothetical protein
MRLFGQTALTNRATNPAFPPLFIIAFARLHYRVFARVLFSRIPRHPMHDLLNLDDLSDRAEKALTLALAGQPVTRESLQFLSQAAILPRSNENGL